MKISAIARNICKRETGLLRRDDSKFLAAQNSNNLLLSCSPHLPTVLTQTVIVSGSNRLLTRTRRKKKKTTAIKKTLVSIKAKNSCLDERTFEMVSGNLLNPRKQRTNSSLTIREQRATIVTIRSTRPLVTEKFIAILRQKRFLQKSYV